MNKCTVTLNFSIRLSEMHACIPQAGSLAKSGTAIWESEYTEYFLIKSVRPGRAFRLRKGIAGEEEKALAWGSLTSGYGNWREKGERYMIVSTCFMRFRVGWPARLAPQGEWTITDSVP
jgi:hypothetical protein